MNISLWYSPNLVAVIARGIFELQKYYLKGYVMVFTNQ